MAKGIPFGDKPSPAAQIVKGMGATGRHGGVLQKVSAGKMGHAKPPTTPVKTDRGNFKIKG